MAGTHGAFCPGSTHIDPWRRVHVDGLQEIATVLPVAPAVDHINQPERERSKGAGRQGDWYPRSLKMNKSYHML